MSAICGIYNFDGQPISDNEISPIMDALSAYGAEGSSIWLGASVGLGHQMTFVTPESREERLPWHEETLELTITADARLDNREQLFDALAIRGQERTMPDSQLIVRAYQKWGTDCPSRLLGDFAFAIWDERRRQLFVARDILGIKPFYYHYHHATSKHFIFASEIEAVLSAPNVPRSLDYSFLAAHFKHHGGYAHPELTYWQDVRTLKPAHAATVSEAGINTWAYWEPTQVPDLRLTSDEEYSEMLLDLLKQAVACRLRSAYPIGSHLSGGLDSSTVTALVAQQLRQVGKSLVAFSWSPPPSPEEDISQDERALVKAVAEKEGLEYYFTPTTVYDVAEYRLRRADQAKAGYYREEVVRQRCASKEIRVMLSGWGGDELIAFNGRGFFAEKFLQGQWGLMTSELKQRTTLSNENVLKGLLISAHQKVLLPLLPDRLYFWQEALFGRLKKRPRYHYPTLPPIFDPDFAAHLQNAQLDSDRVQKKRLRERPGVRANQLALLMNGHLTRRIEGWAHEGAAHKIEYRYPLLDQRVIEFCLSLPPEMFMKTGWKRYLFRHTTMKKVLPDSVAWNKSKQESALGVSHKASRAAWAKEVLLPLLKEALAEGQHLECLNVSRIKELIKQDPDDGGETVRQAGLIPALRIELMVNPKLAAWIKQKEIVTSNQ